MLIVTTRLGGRVIGKQNFNALLELMSLPVFNGCLGGMPEKARFLTGRHEERISYLDPHYV
jgi:cysteine protease ATG4